MDDKTLKRLRDVMEPLAARGKPGRLKPQRAMILKPHRRPDGSCVEPVIILDCETTAPIRVEGAEICYAKETV